MTLVGNGALIHEAVYRGAQTRRVLVIGGETNDWYCEHGATPLRLRDFLLPTAEALGLPLVWYRRGRGACTITDAGPAPFPGVPDDPVGAVDALVGTALDPGRPALVVIDGVDHLLAAGPTGHEEGRAAEVLDALVSVGVHPDYQASGSVLVLCEQLRSCPSLSAAPGIDRLDLRLPGAVERQHFLEQLGLDACSARSLVPLTCALRLDELAALDLSGRSVDNVAAHRTGALARLGLHPVGAPACAGPWAPAIEAWTLDQLSSGVLGRLIGLTLVDAATAPAVAVHLAALLRCEAFTTSAAGGVGALPEGTLRRLLPVDQPTALLEPLRTGAATGRALEWLATAGTTVITWHPTPGTIEQALPAASVVDVRALVGSGASTPS